MSVFRLRGRADDESFTLLGREALDARLGAGVPGQQGGQPLGRAGIGGVAQGQRRRVQLDGQHRRPEEGFPAAPGRALPLGHHAGGGEQHVQRRPTEAFLHLPFEQTDALDPGEGSQQRSGCGSG